MCGWDGSGFAKMQIEMEVSGDRAATLQVAQFYLWGLNTVQVDRIKAEQLLRKCLGGGRGGHIGCNIDMVAAEAGSLLLEILKTSSFEVSIEQRQILRASGMDECCFQRSWKRIELDNNFAVTALQIERQNRDRDAAISELVRRAKSGEPRAQAHLGINEDKSLHWSRAAAQQGHAGAQWWLSRMQPESLTKKEAKHWLDAGVEQGDPACLTSLGLDYEFLGDLHSLLRAVSCYEKAAQLGDLRAQYYLGICYLEGRGVKENLIVAKHWFTRASSSGHFRATQALRHPLLAGLSSPLPRPEHPHPPLM